MKKFILDVAEIGKDLWLGFVWLVQLVCILQEIIASKFSKFILHRHAKKTLRATKEVINNCVAEG